MLNKELKITQVYNLRTFTNRIKEVSWKVSKLEQRNPFTNLSDEQKIELIVVYRQFMDEVVGIVGDYLKLKKEDDR